MRKLLKYIAAGALACLFIVLLCGAAVPDEVDDQLAAIGADELEDELSDDTRALMERLGIKKIDAQSLISLSPSDFFNLVFELVKDAIRTPVRTFLAVMGVAVLCALLSSMKQTLGGKSMDTVFNIVSVAAIASAIIAPVMDCITKTAAAIEEFSLFMLSLVPVLSSVMVVSGRPLTATGYQTMVFVAAQFVSRISSEALVPLLGIYMALCLTGAVSRVDVTSLASAVKSVVNWCLGLMMTLFVGLLSIQSLVASSMDELSMKTAKFLIGSFVPVVGGALSDALTTAQGCMGLVKTAVGVYGILAAALTFLPVLLSAAAWRLTVGASAAVCDMLGIKPISKVLGAAGTVLGILISITLCFALLMIITTAIVLVAGGSA